jgi:hypothetical protein
MERARRCHRRSLPALVTSFPPAVCRFGKAPASKGASLTLSRLHYLVRRAAGDPPSRGRAQPHRPHMSRGTSTSWSSDATPMQWALGALGLPMTMALLARCLGTTSQPAGAQLNRTAPPSPWSVGRFPLSRPRYGEVHAASRRSLARKWAAEAYRAPRSQLRSGMVAARGRLSFTDAPSYQLGITVRNVGGCQSSRGRGGPHRHFRHRPDLARRLMRPRHHRPGAAMSRDHPRGYRGRRRWT